MLGAGRGVTEREAHAGSRSPCRGCKLGPAPKSRFPGGGLGKAEQVAQELSAKAGALEDMGALSMPEPLPQWPCGGSQAIKLAKDPSKRGVEREEGSLCERRQT
jgi:hypothetical protein